MSRPQGSYLAPKIVAAVTVVSVLTAIISGVWWQGLLVGFVVVTLALGTQKAVHSRRSKRKRR